MNFSKLEGFMKPANLLDFLMFLLIFLLHYQLLDGDHKPTAHVVVNSLKGA